MHLFCVHSDAIFRVHAFVRLLSLRGADQGAPLQISVYCHFNTFLGLLLKIKMFFLNIFLSHTHIFQHILRLEIN